jgi:hypothetical protein
MAITLPFFIVTKRDALLRINKRVKKSTADFRFNGINVTVTLKAFQSELKMNFVISQHIYIQ